MDQPTALAPSSVVVTKDIWDQVMAHLRGELPNEGVGLLGCSPIAGTDAVKAEVFYPGRNTLQSPTRYELDMQDLVRALADIERRGLVLGAIVHSHPVGAPRPSSTDLREAYYPESLMVIVSFRSEPYAVRGWKLHRSGDTWQPENVPVRVVGTGVEIAFEGQNRE